MQLTRWFRFGEYRHALQPGRRPDDALQAVAGYLADRGEIDMNEGRVVFRHPRRRNWLFAHPFDLTGIARAELRGGEDGLSLISTIETWRPVWVACAALLLWGVVLAGVIRDVGDTEQVVVAAAWLFLIVPFSAVVFRALVGLAWRSAVSNALSRSV